MEEPTPTRSVRSGLSARSGITRYTDQYLSRMKAITQRRAHQQQKLERDFTESRATGRSMAFPNTRYMDLLPPAKRGFDVFLTDHNHSAKNRSLPTTPGTHRNLNTTYGSDDDTVFRLKCPRGLFSEERKNMLMEEAVQSYSAVYRDAAKESPQPYHLILHVLVQALSGDQNPIWQFRGIVTTTSMANKLDMSKSLYMQLNLPRRLFSVKIVNKKDSGLKSYRFQSQLEGGNQLDMSLLSWCLCETTRIEVSFVEKISINAAFDQQLSLDESGGGEPISILKIGSRDSDDEYISGTDNNHCDEHCIL